MSILSRAFTTRKSDGLRKMKAQLTASVLITLLIINNCSENLVDTFLKETDHFSLTLPDSKDRTLADVFCQEFPNVPESKLQLGRIYKCDDNGGDGSFFSSTMLEIYSKQKLECKEGKAIVTGAAIFLNAQFGMIFSLLGISFAHFKRFM